MKKLFLSSILCLGALLAGAGESTWLTDLATAQAKAKAEGKIVLVDFTGSDWCGWCIKLHKEVFSKPEFLLWATGNAVLVEIDFPKRKKLSAELQRANDALAQKYNIEGFPTIIVLSSEGKKLGTLGYIEGGPKPFIAEVKRLAPKNAKADKAPADLTVQARGQNEAQPKADEAPKEEAVAKPTPVPAVAPAKQIELKLKGISGTASRRFALINNETVTVGEEFKIKLAGGVARVRCLEIKDKSAVVSINGGPAHTELFLADSREE
jgi:thioredoxin-related protein